MNDQPRFRIPVLDTFLNPRPAVAVIRLSGVIGAFGAFRRGMTLSGLERTLERAFKVRGLKAVALAINSPGGSAVQSALIAGRIRDLAAEKGVPVFAFAEDVAASGGYWLALAGDEIYAHENSIVGSIGVVSAGFGFPELLKRIGVERRLHKSGDRKAALDPFLDENAGDVKRLRTLQKDIHQSFQDFVRLRRGDKLHGKDASLFSGEFWTGKRARELGLIDAIGDMRTVMRERFGEDVRLKSVTGGLWWKRRARLPGAGFGVSGSGRPAPTDWAAGVIAAVEERLTWNRFGL